jgi:hypothetical protein
LDTVPVSDCGESGSGKVAGALGGTQLVGPIGTATLTVDVVPLQPTVTHVVLATGAGKNEYVFCERSRIVMVDVE